jgi:O-antigen ligase/tetratricopeptide (TPR) repeat protein
MSIVAESPRSRLRYRPRSALRVSGDGLEKWLGLAVEVLLGSVIVLAPLAFGGVEQWAQRWMMLGVGAATLCLLVRWIAYPRTFRVAWTLAYVPMACFLLLVVLQWMPLPSSVVSFLSPKAAEAWTDVQHLLPGEVVRQTISLYPLATERQLRLVLLVCGVFALVFTHFREREQIVRLLWTIVLSGSLVGAVALSQNLTNGDSTWLGVKTAHAHAGPFMNHSAFGQFMNLSTGAALALLLVGLKRQVGDRALSFRSLRHHLFRRSSASLILPLLFILTAPVLVALSMTRGGVLSIVIAGSIVGVILGFSNNGRATRTLIASLGFVIVLILLKVGFDRVYDRMATLRDLHETGAGVRVQMLRDMVPMVRDFPLVGIGLGAFSHLFPAYDTATEPGFATHAENEYAQLAVETGVVGIALAATFLAIVLLNAFSALRHGRRSIHAAAAGLLLGLICILIHSASDFGQHVPAIACITAATMALLIRLGTDARADRVATDSENGSHPRTTFTRCVAICVSIVLMGMWVWMVGRLGVESEAEREWSIGKRNYLELERRGLAEASDNEFIQVLGHLARAAEIVPGDADYRFGLNAIRWQSIDRYDRSLTADFLSQISGECLMISAVAPYFGPAVTLAGQIRAFDLGDGSGVPLIRRGYSLAPYSREASYAVAILDARDGNWDACMHNLRRSIELGTARSDAAQLLVDKFNRTDLAIELVNDSRPDMVSLSLTLERAGQHEQARTLRDRATEMLISEANKPDAPLEALVQLADAYVRIGKHEDAIPLLRRALAVRYDRSEWRTALIHSLVQSGDTALAVAEARINYQLNPGNAKAKQLLEDLVAGPSSRKVDR